MSLLKNPILIGGLGIFLAVIYCLMLLSAKIFSTADATHCNGTLIVPYNGGLAKAVCSDLHLLASGQSIILDHDVITSSGPLTTEYLIDLSKFPVTVVTTT